MTDSQPTKAIADARAAAPGAAKPSSHARAGDAAVAAATPAKPAMTPAVMSMGTHTASAPPAVDHELGAGVTADGSTVKPSTKALLPWLVAVAFFMESLDTTILNTAVPTIAAALHVAPLSMKSVLASYTLSLAVFIPISGWMADRFGTRRVFASAIGLFTLGSILCGISANIHELVACRILQGCGGAMMVPVGRLTLVRTFAKSELHPRDELRRHSRPHRTDARPDRRRPHRRLLPLARDFLRQRSDRPRSAW